MDPLKLRPRLPAQRLTALTAKHPRPLVLLCVLTTVSRTRVRADAFRVIWRTEGKATRREQGRQKRGHHLNSRACWTPCTAPDRQRHQPEGRQRASEEPRLRGWAVAHARVRVLGQGFIHTASVPCAIEGPGAEAPGQT